MPHRHESLEANRPASEGRLPDFIVIGAQKAGTTSLDFYLNLHPEIHMARPKEPNFFVDDLRTGTWHRGVEWYRRLFISKKRLCGESSPNYTASPAVPGVPGRIAAVVPEAKLIYLVREPYARLQSNYLMARRIGLRTDTFADFVVRDPPALSRSMYAQQYREYLSHFSPHRILVVESERLERERDTTLADIFRFLGVDERFSSPLFRQRRHVRSGRRHPNETGRRLLASAPLQWARRTLHSGVYWHLSNALLMPFSESPPSTTLPPGLARDVLAKLRADVQLLRALTASALPSLDPPLAP